MGPAPSSRGWPTDGSRPRLVGHRSLPARLARYRLTDGYNQAVNQRQFGRVPNWDLAGGWAFPMCPNWM